MKVLGLVMKFDLCNYKSGLLVVLHTISFPLVLFGGSRDIPDSVKLINQGNPINNRYCNCISSIHLAY